MRGVVATMGFQQENATAIGYLTRKKSYKELRANTRHIGKPTLILS